MASTLDKETALREFDVLMENWRQAPWKIGDWLVEMVPETHEGRGNYRSGDSYLSLSELARRSGRSQAWLSELRQVAKDYQPHQRVAKASSKAHMQALKKWGGDVAAASAWLQEHSSLRDSSPPLDDNSAARLLTEPEARSRVLDKLDPEHRVGLVQDIVKAETGAAEVAAAIQDPAVSQVVSSAVIRHDAAILAEFPKHEPTPREEALELTGELRDLFIDIRILADHLAKFDMTSLEDLDRDRQADLLGRIAPLEKGVMRMKRALGPRVNGPIVDVPSRVL